MSKSITNGIGVSVARDPSPPADEIRRHLQQILASPVFHGSKRCQQFLEYVCAKSLAGEAGSLKERTVAVEVFGRPPHIDLGEDTIVRVGAREVRKRLAQYYTTPEGAASEIRIDLPSGSYPPDFRHVRAIQQGEGPAPVPPLAKQPPRHGDGSWIVWGALGTVAGLTALVYASLAA